MKIGFIGLGIMGSRMAANLLKAGFDLTVFNRTKEKAEKLIDNGAKWGNSIEETAQESDVLITMLSTPEIVAKMAFGGNGFLQHLNEDKVWINSSTIDNISAKLFTSKADEYGIKYLDAPVSGSLKPAENGELIFLVGGDKMVFENHLEIFEIMGKKSIYCGDYGSGSAMKLVINKILGEAMLAFAEGMKFGQTLGLNKQLLLDTLLNSAVVPPLMKLKREQIENENYEAEFPLKWLQKDLFLATRMAYEYGISLPSGSNAKEIYAMAKEKGLGDLDISAIYKFLK